MRFLRPNMLEWLLIVPAIVACLMIQHYYRRRVSRASPIAPRFLALSRRTRGRTRAATLAAAVICAGAMVFALSQPQVNVASRDPQFERQDLIVVLDRSVSMRARDVEPSRLVRATSEIRNFLQRRPDSIDRVALVGFADSSLVLSYPTSDMGSLFFFLDWINDDEAPLYGTNMGGALLKALELVKKDPRKTQKLVLLISDGEDLGAELATAVDMFRAARIRVHCVGIGSDAPVPIPLAPVKSGAVAVLNEEDRLKAARLSALQARGESVLPDQTGHLLDEEERPMMTRFSEVTLRQIADSTGGRYVRSSTGSEMAAAISTIVQGERKLVGWKTMTDYRDLYDAGLAAALLAGAALWLIL
ncbi:MAG: VWA domain-containing protein [Acidobacteriota bacterium]